MAIIAIIGGTGLTKMPGLTINRRQMVKTRFGAPSSPLIHGELNGRDVIFLARHGRRHTIPPHMINYRANLLALHEVGATHVIALTAVSGIAEECTDKTIVIPDQIIDYTHDRAHSFHDAKYETFDHVDFTQPYSSDVRARLLEGCKAAGVNHVSSGCYGVTQGPRQETAAEIRRMENDGCSVAGMTGMPEASLARELGIEYGCCAMVSNRAAGKLSTGINFSEIETNLNESIGYVRKVVTETLVKGFE